ncbi:MAG TPA: zinc ribbon domain-containing protein [Gemmataceae bacterium]|nr:zinc ribbon domain-containing protein [Gemmataceae bacterium]
MPATCKSCRRANPRGAAFCYHDGTPLDGGSDSSAIDAGSRPFAAPFVLPGGKSCRNFNQLALACQEDRTAALTVLTKGHLETFLAAQGRADLAEAARAASRGAARTANGERALDDFLGRLPAPALLAPRLLVEPELIDLGILQPGQDRRCEVVLRNKGMRLLYGSVSCDGCPWLSLGNGPVRQRMLFQFSGQTAIPLRVLGSRLRAFRDPQAAEVRVESNGGTATVVVRVRVPVRPFPDGPLAGALSPRELASKAHNAPKEAAALIESGAVARWYAANGWPYPVQGPTATGYAAVQQLFEALGLVKPPRVELGEESVAFLGTPGQKFEYVLAVVAQENRAVVAHATSDQPWLRVGPTVFRGRSAFLSLNVPAVPDRPGETLHARLSVTANGNQRFTVPVTLSVVGAAPRPAPAARPAAVPIAVPAVPPPNWPTVKPAARARPGWKTFLPAGLLALALLGVIARDYFAPARPAPKPPQEDAVPRVEIRLHDSKRGDVLDTVWLTDPAPTRRFGLVTLYEGQPVGAGAAVNRLTFDPWGRTNNTCLRFDGKDERLYGSTRGRWEKYDDAGSVWVCDDLNVAVTQSVGLARGDASGLLDTARVRYRIENRGGRPRTVGLRFLLDTYIGANDGVPFTIPGDKELCDTLKDLRATDDRPVPDFLQALEKPDLAHPGTVAHLRLRPDDLKESPERVTLGAWPSDRLRVLDRNADGPLTLWDVPVLSIKTFGLNDSAVVMYWKEQALPPGATRDLGFDYGLGSVTAQGGRLGVTVDGAFRPGGQLTVVAYVSGSGDETVTLSLPGGFALVEGAAAQPAPPSRGGNRPVTWRVRAGATGKYELTVKSGAGASQAVPVEIKAAIFD